MRCPKCGGYRFNSDDICLDCGYSIPITKPPAWWGAKDFQSPASSNIINGKDDESSSNTSPILEICPRCNKKSFFWNEHSQLYECLNLECKYTSADKTPVELERCPFCHERALFWNNHYQIYECLKCDNRLIKARDQHGKAIESSCPFCGKSEGLLYQTDLKSWRCTLCSKTFLNPRGIERLQDTLGKFRAINNEPFLFSKVLPCAYHPDRESVDACLSCGKKVCRFCKTIINDRTYCPECVEKINDPTKKGVPDDTPTPGFLDCPECETKSLFWNERCDFYECRHCRRSFTKSQYEYRKTEEYKKSATIQVTSPNWLSHPQASMGIRWSWVFIILLSIFGIIFIVYPLNLILSHRLNMYVGLGIIVIGAILILRNLSAMKKRYLYKNATSGQIISTIIWLAII